MPKLGLALSGGGFRATLYHLGIVRFLRDADALRHVTHITSVSGGSVLAAHLVLNWDRYNGTPEEFDAAAREVLDFVSLDVRNRIVRRYPFIVIGYALRWLTRRPPDRRLTRTGLLERYYRKHLYGDTCLYELPEGPELHMLATNLSEGCITSFTRSGLIMQRRLPGDRVQFERIQAGLATIPLAVAASSAFPGFFPPIRITAADIGAAESAFSKQAFTDGGVFDNLGIRAFRFIERCWSDECRPSDVGGREIEVEHAGEHEETRDDHAVRKGSRTREQVLAVVGRGADDGVGRFESNGDSHATEAQPGDGTGERPDHVPAGPPPVRPSASQFDVVVASDAGAKLSIHRDAFSGGLIETAMRASDILMDRVWQLEKEIFGAAPGFLFTPIYRMVEPNEDPDAPPLVVQRQIVGTRTDMDRFSPEEIRSLVAHGYCVARQACRARPDVFGTDLPSGPPWDPLPKPPAKPSAFRAWRGRPASEETVLARRLQESAVRRIFSTLLDRRDFMTYLFVPFMLLLALAPAYLVYRTYTSTTGVRQALGLISESNQDEARLLGLIRNGPVKSIEALTPQPVDRLEPADYRGFEFLSDSHIVDLRRWDLPTWSLMGNNPPEVYQHRRYLVRRVEAKDADDHLRIQFTSRSPSLDVDCNHRSLGPVLRRMAETGPEGDAEGYRWELDLDFSRVPFGMPVEVVVDQLYRGSGPGDRRSGENALVHLSYGVTKLATMWLLMPDRRPSGRLRLVGYRTGRPQERQPVRPTRLFEALDGAVVGWQIIGPDPDTTYEGHWILD